MLHTCNSIIDTFMTARSGMVWRGTSGGRTAEQMHIMLAGNWVEQIEARGATHRVWADEDQCAILVYDDGIMSLTIYDAEEFIGALTRRIQYYTVQP